MKERQTTKAIRGITRRMTDVELNLQEQFTNLYCKKDFEYLLRMAKKAEEDRRPSILKKIARMITEVGVQCDHGQNCEYYERLVSELPIPQSNDGVKKKLVEAICRNYVYYPKPEEFMTRIVDALDPESALSASLQLRIFKRFLQTVNVKENTKYRSKTLAKVNVDEIDESIFNALSSKEEKPDYLPLLQASYNLANGRFISPASTKEALFLLAFAYDMRYYFSKEDKNYNVNRDVETNLFIDYYCDNITRYIYQEDGGKSGSSDTEPSGIGLNPKNFIDVIFIYCLNQESLSPDEKVSKFFSTVNQVKEAWKTRNDYLEDMRRVFEATPTGTYRTKLRELLKPLQEDELVAFLLENYYCDVRYAYTNKKTGETELGSKGIFELQFSTNSAYDSYCELVSMIKEALQLPDDTDFSKIDRRAFKDTTNERSMNDLYSEDDSMVIMRLGELEKTVYTTYTEHLDKVKLSEDDRAKITRIMESIEKRLDPYTALTVSSAVEVTRTKLIAAYYHYFCLENGYSDPNTWRSFKDVYDDICHNECLNRYLEEAGYQYVSPKNLYDIFIIFLIYCRLNNF